MGWLWTHQLSVERAYWARGEGRGLTFLGKAPAWPHTGGNPFWSLPAPASGSNSGGALQGPGGSLKTLMPGLHPQKAFKGSPGYSNAQPGLRLSGIVGRVHSGVRRTLVFNSGATSITSITWTDQLPFLNIGFFNGKVGITVTMSQSGREVRQHMATASSRMSRRRRTPSVLEALRVSLSLCFFQGSPKCIRSWADPSSKAFPALPTG